MINSFSGEYAFLSNFYPAKFICRFTLIQKGDYSFPTVEHFYQVAKAATSEDFDRVMSCSTAAQAKKMGRRIQLNPYFEPNKYTIMLEGVWAKFSQNPYLQQKLIATNGHELIEGNWWNDKYWGVCLKTNQGQNKLGHILMYVRNVLVDHFNSTGGYYGN